MSGLTPTCVWRISDQLAVSLDERFGPPIDAYVNGSQVWLRPDGPDNETLEWRLHPVADFARPEGVDVHDLFPRVALAVATGGPPPRAPDQLWDGLECFPAHGDELEPAVLAGRAGAALGMPPDAFGMVDHRVIGDRWEHSAGRISIVGELLDQLTTEQAQP